MHRDKFAPISPGAVQGLNSNDRLGPLDENEHTCAASPANYPATQLFVMHLRIQRNEYRDKKETHSNKK